MKTLYSIICLLFVSILSPYYCTAQNENSEFKMPAQDMRGRQWEKQGELFTLKIIPFSKEYRFYIVGKEAAVLNVNKVSVTGKVKLGNNEKLIQFSRKHDYFTTKDQLTGDLNIKLEEKETKKMEEFRLRLDKP